MQLRLGRPSSQSEHLGDFLVPIAFDIMQHKHLFRPVGQTLHGGLEVHCQLQPGTASGDNVQRRISLQVSLSSGAECLSPSQDHVHGQAMQPGTEGGFTPECAQLLPGPDEDVLGHLVGIVIVQHAPNQAVDPGHMVSIEPLECAGIAAGSQRRIHSVRIGPAGLFVLQCHHSEVEFNHCAGLDRLVAQKVAVL
jgi:hypothetical protein